LSVESGTIVARHIDAAAPIVFYPTRAHRLRSQSVKWFLLIVDLNSRDDHSRRSRVGERSRMLLEEQSIRGAHTNGALQVAQHQVISRGSSPGRTSKRMKYRDPRTPVSRRSNGVMTHH
jgi:hypothetical protein